MVGELNVVYKGEPGGAAKCFLFHLLPVLGVLYSGWQSIDFFIKSVSGFCFVLSLRVLLCSTRPWICMAHGIS